MMFVGQLQGLQKRFDQVEDELQKKRAELREALCQDNGMVGMHQARLTKVNGDGIHREMTQSQRGTMTLKPFSGSQRCNDESTEMVNTFLQLTLFA